ncbi:MAG: hypothetical protein UHX00_03825 [Caryophanon sp.]|uniref:Uncharacterized protein n=1 Tax=Caryophanon latum TaxID=33977 RepID=A0A1C0YTI7_9BACL|nr:hypothetical protein [Caryophanon latum]MEE1130742.1 hypothetical protein [Caryophanon sp.]OCS90459.1 hypothetical protein A6K76_11375 [Caryophanon latum]
MNVIETVKKLATTEQPNAQLMSSYGDYILHPESKVIIKEALKRELMSQQKELTESISRILIEHELYTVLSEADTTATQEYLELANGTLELYREQKEQLRTIEKTIRNLEA